MHFSPSVVSTLAIAAASLALGACSTLPGDVAPVAQAGATQVTTQLPRDVRPLHYSISVAPDAANLRFSGSVIIDVEVLASTESITLNAAELDIASATLTAAGGRAIKATRIAADPDRQTATFRFGGRIAAGRHRLAIDYAGKINTQAAGLFALDYDSAEGKKRALYTQFEAPDARRFFPGWDEPNFRTPYDLQVTVPAGQSAISNLPEAGRQARTDGSTIVSFRTTPAMSSYLLFLAVGEFDRITTMSAGTQIGVVTKKGDGEKGRYALEGSVRLLPYYNDYFGTVFPLPKLDNVAGPGSSQFFTAMENWGAIFSFESILLVDPSITSEATRQRIFKVAAHEMAHQWFGDLVTMEWWDDLWLNEGFASWMGTKATAALHPEWEPLLGRIDGREDAIGLDSVATTHAVVQSVETVDQISQAFDAITYRKGEAVITMLEDYVGEDAWRAGVRDYMASYRLKNTVTDNLWAKIERAAGKPVTAIAHDFTLQPGVPLIRVTGATCAGGQTEVELTQGEFSRDRADKQPLAWRVPVIASTIGGAEARTLVEGGAGRVTVPGCGAVIINKGQTGYYRTLYTPAMLDRLTADYAKLKPVDQIGLLADNWGLGLAGYQSAAEALDLVDAVPSGANSALWGRVTTILSGIHDMYESDPARRALIARYASARLSPALTRLGWTARPNERANDALLRADLIATLGAMGDPAVTAEANRRFASQDPALLDGPLKSTILAIVAVHADTATWDKIRAQAQAERSPLVRAELYRALGAARDERLARRALALALTDEPGATTGSAIIGRVAGAHPDLAFDYALRNRAAIEPLIDASSRSRYLPGLAASSSDPAMVAKLQDYATRYMTPQSRRPADIAIARIQDRMRVRETRLPDITRWLEARGR